MMDDKPKKTFWKTVRIPLAVIGGAVILIWTILQGYPVSWTGFADYTTPTGEFVRGKTLWDWLELLIIPLILGLGALAFNRSEREAERRGIEARSQLKRELTTENQREAALQSYLDKMTELLLKEQLKEEGNESVQDVARIRTLIVLRGLDPARKGLVIKFLQEAGLIQQPDVIINLAGADLRDADLRGADLIRAALLGADLRRANLSGAMLQEADIRTKYLENIILEGSIYDITTKWPEDFNAKLAGAIFAYG